MLLQQSVWTEILYPILTVLHCKAFPKVFNSCTRKACWRGNKLCSHQIVHDSKQLLFYSYNFSGKEARVELGTCAIVTAAVCWLRLWATQNDRCSPEVLIWTAASNRLGTDEAKLIFPGMKLINHSWQGPLCESCVVSVLPAAHRGEAGNIYPVGCEIPLYQADRWKCSRQLTLRKFFSEMTQSALLRKNTGR